VNFNQVRKARLQIKNFVDLLYLLNNIKFTNSSASVTVINPSTIISNIPISLLLKPPASNNLDSLYPSMPFACFFAKCIIIIFPLYTHFSSIHSTVQISFIISIAFMFLEIFYYYYLVVLFGKVFLRILLANWFRQMFFYDCR
jgi:hypothetical protein